MFLSVCAAIDYAHQRGVIHRDLKLSNIMVIPPPEESDRGTFTERAPQVKILDFGLARMTDSDVSIATMGTEAGMILGTLPYLSPERARGNPDEIDIRTDGYSLGAILYETLTGELPCETRRTLLHEAIRVHCEEEPKKSSTFRRALRGHLDTIALKALEKERDARCQSAVALREDIERHPSSPPSAARPPSAAYQLRKLVLRHKAPFAFAGSVLLLLIAPARPRQVSPPRARFRVEIYPRIW